MSAEKANATGWLEGRVKARAALSHPDLCQETRDLYKRAYKMYGRRIAISTPASHCSIAA